MKTDSELTLEEIQKALEGVENKRFEKNLTDLDRNLLEETSVTLRTAERLAITDLQTGIIKSFEQDTSQVNTQAKDIRSLVTRLNRLAKRLDKTGTIIKEAVKVLRSFSKWLAILILGIFLFTSCAVNKSQLTRIQQLTANTDSVMAAPSALFQSLADIREGRGLIYVASLSATEPRIQELNALAEAAVSDSIAATKADVYVKVLNSYLRALKSLSAETRWSEAGTQIRSIGRNVDSLIMAHNELPNTDELEVGIARQASKIAAYPIETYYRHRQFKMLKKMVVEGDTLVSLCCDALIQTMNKDEVKRLIENEKTGLESNYRSYLLAQALDDRHPDIRIDETYLSLQKKISDTRKIQSTCVTALRSLKRAHHSLVVQMDKGATYSVYSDRILELSDQARAVMELVN